MTEHATLSASGAARWLACPPSAQLEKQFPREESPYASEGTTAHALAELTLLNTFGIIDNDEALTRFREIQDQEFYTESMDDYVQVFTDVVTGWVADYENCGVLIEYRVDFSPWVPGGFGTADAIVISGKEMWIYDLKFGKGVPVDAKGNPQIRLYALGALNTLGWLYEDIETVHMSIVQPRLDSITTETMTTADLMTWADKTVAPLAARAIKGEGEFAAGDHCRFCRARHSCRTRAEANLDLAKHEFADPPTLSAKEIGAILEEGQNLSNWLSDLQSYALTLALDGQKVEGWKLVRGRSNRKYDDKEKIMTGLQDASYDIDTFAPRDLVGITILQKIVRKEDFKKLVNPHVTKPPGKPTLVPLSDKREPMDPLEEAKNEFKE